MKWIGLIFLILCGAMAGMACSGKLRMKLERTEKLCSFLREMGVLMQYQMSTLGELLDTFSNRSVYQEFQFLSQTAAHMQQQTPFVQAWSEQVQAEKHLSPEVKEVLLELGRTWDNGFGGAAFRLVTGTYSIAAVSGYLPCHISEKRKALPQFGVAGWIAAGSSFLLRK